MTADPDFLGAWTWWLLVGSVDVALLIAIVWAADRLATTRLHPQVRHGLWLLVGARLCLPPGLIQLPDSTVVGTLAAPVQVPLSEGSGWWPAVLLAGWALGGAALAVTWWIRARRASLGLVTPGDDGASRRLCQRVQYLSARLGLRRMPRLLVDARASAPYVTGLATPRLVVPADWGAWPEALFDHAIGHELAHLQRHDLRFEAAWMALTAVYWFHPMVHLARRRAYEAREACCDARAAAVFGGAYRDSVLRLLAGITGEAAPVGVPGRHSWGPLVTRLKILEQWPARPPRRARLAGATVLAVGALAILPARLAPANPTDGAIVDAQLTDPTARQEAGLGSLHVRYELMRRNNLERSQSQ